MVRAAWALAAVVLLAALVRADDGSVRRLPYPHEHVVTFSNDADLQQAGWVDAYQRFVNGALGLPVTSSLWVVGQGGSDTYLFAGGDLNRAPSGVDGHAIFGLLLRSWHRGAYDHIHGWTAGGHSL